MCRLLKQRPRKGFSAAGGGTANKPNFTVAGSGKVLYAILADLSVIGNAWEALLLWGMEVGFPILRATLKINVVCVFYF